MKSYRTLTLLLLCVLAMVSCVRDVDFDQASDIVLEPVVELNLVYFTLRPADFVDPETNLPVETVRDTTEIRFLDDPETNESLVRADFYFKFTNSIARDLEIDLRFITQARDTVYTAATNVLAGAPEGPVITEFEQVITDPEIRQLTLANRLVVAVTFPSPDPNLNGELNLQSKTTYYLEIRDRE